MAGFQIVQQCRNEKLFIGIKLTITINRKVNHSQESVGIHIVILTRLSDRFVTKTKTDTKTAKHLQQVVIIANKRDHLVIRFIHFLIFHLTLTYF